MRQLTISWTTSRGRDTYGWNICRLDDSRTGRRFRTTGGGYDMIGTVFGDWLTEHAQDRLRNLAKERADQLQECGYSVQGYKKLPDLYGLTFAPDGRASVDGACGISSVQRIAEAVGIGSQWIGNRRGNTIGYTVFGEE